MPLHARGTRTDQARACPECQGLWQEHASATREHIRLNSKLQVAALSHDDPAAIQVLNQQVEGTKAQRERTRAAMRKHEATTHLEDAAADLSSTFSVSGSRKTPDAGCSAGSGWPGATPGVGVQSALLVLFRFELFGWNRKRLPYLFQ